MAFELLGDLGTVFELKHFQLGYPNCIPRIEMRERAILLLINTIKLSSKRCTLAWSGVMLESGEHVGIVVVNCGSDFRLVHTVVDLAILTRKTKQTFCWILIAVSVPKCSVSVNDTNKS